jgi:hypothetical protein
MTAFQNFFMAFSYNADGGSFGDEADEGWSLAFFANPNSFNYQLGQAFRDSWEPVLPDPIFVPCGTGMAPGEACAGLVEYVFDPNIISVFPGHTDFSNALLVVQQVPVPASVWLLMSGLGLMAALARRQRPNSVPALV